jgi:tRNA (guanine-N7-)-methyltransferase
MRLRAGGPEFIGGRMRAAFQPKDPAEPDPAERIEFVPADYFARAKLEDIFPRSAPLQVDIGCGEGSFLEEMAQSHPEQNFLGIERLLGRVRKVCRAAARKNLENVRILRIETAYALRYVLPLESVSVAHVLFPDPWPKRYHHPRRLVQDGFMQALHSILVPGGELRIKTDDEPYFQWIEKTIDRAKGYEKLDWPEEAGEQRTDFERRFLSQGMPIYRARLKKV